VQTSATDLPVAVWALAEEASALVGKYPDLTPGELERLIDIHPRLPMLHLALMTSDEELAPRLEAFQQKYRRRIRTPFRQYASFFIPIAMLAVVALRSIL
jgi:hypothetical protein